MKKRRSSCQISPVLWVPAKPNQHCWCCLFRARIVVTSPSTSAYWVKETLNVLGTLFGGATAFPRGEGVWRDDAQGGKLLLDNPVVINCYTNEGLIEENLPVLRDFLHRMGREARQGAIGLVIDDDYFEIGFPLEEAPTPKQPKRKKRR